MHRKTRKIQGSLVKKKTNKQKKQTKTKHLAQPMKSFHLFLLICSPSPGEKGNSP